MKISLRQIKNTACRGKVSGLYFEDKLFMIIRNNDFFFIDSKGMPYNHSVHTEYGKPWFSDGQYHVRRSRAAGYYNIMTYIGSMFRGVGLVVFNAKNRTEAEKKKDELSNYVMTYEDFCKLAKVIDIHFESKWDWPRNAVDLTSCYEINGAYTGNIDERVTYLSNKYAGQELDDYEHTERTFNKLLETYKHEFTFYQHDDIAKQKGNGDPIHLVEYENAAAKYQKEYKDFVAKCDWSNATYSYKMYRKYADTVPLLRAAAKEGLDRYNAYVDEHVYGKGVKNDDPKTQWASHAEPIPYPVKYDIYGFKVPPSP